MDLAWNQDKDWTFAQFWVPTCCFESVARWRCAIVSQMDDLSSFVMAYCKMDMAFPDVALMAIGWNILHPYKYWHITNETLLCKQAWNNFCNHGASSLSVSIKSALFLLRNVLQNNGRYDYLVNSFFFFFPIFPCSFFYSNILTIHSTTEFLATKNMTVYMVSSFGSL